MTMLDKIDHWRTKRGLTQSALERAAGLSENRISKWRNASNPDPRAREVLRVAQALKIPVSYLIDDEMEEPPAIPHLSDAELRAIEMVQANDLSVQEVLRGLSWAVAQRKLAATDGTLRNATDPRPGTYGHEVPIDNDRPGPNPLPGTQGPRRPNRGGSAAG